jgi:hypothetical protein
LGVGLGVEVAVAVGVVVTVAVAVWVAVAVGVGEGIAVGVGIALHLPALPALTMAWISEAERARLVRSTSSMRPANLLQLTLTVPSQSRAVVARGALCAATKGNFKLERIQKIDYLAF